MSARRPSPLPACVTEDCAVGCEAREEIPRTVIHPPVTGEGKSGRVNKVNLRASPVMCGPGDGMWIWGVGPAAGRRQCWLTSARQPGEHHGPGVEKAPGTGRVSKVRNAETPSRSGRSDRLPVGSSAEARAGTGRPRSERRRPKGSRKTSVWKTGPSNRWLAYNWPHTRPGAWARKDADVSRVAL